MNVLDLAMLLLVTFVVTLAAVAILVGDRPTTYGALVSRAVVIWGPIWLSALVIKGAWRFLEVSTGWPFIGVLLVLFAAVCTVMLLVSFSASALWGLKR